MDSYHLIPSNEKTFFCESDSFIIQCNQALSEELRRLINIKSKQQCQELQIIIDSASCKLD